MKTVLYQGDSITDAGRSRDSDRCLGSGYATMCSARLGVAHPGACRFYNRAVSGNRVVDMYARIKIDVLQLKPDVMTVLIGINDVWHELDRQNGFAADKFEKVYSLFIEDTLEVLPHLKMILLEPFVLDGSATHEHFEYFVQETKLRAEVTARLAKKYGLPFVPLQEVISAAAARDCNENILADGVHPTYIGHEIITRELLPYLETALQA